MVATILLREQNIILDRDESGAHLRAMKHRALAVSLEVKLKELFFERVNGG